MEWSMAELVDGRTNPARRYSTLESGGILFFPETPILSAEDREFLLSVRQAGGGFHKNISYKPAYDKVAGFDRDSPETGERLRTILRSYSAEITRFLDEMMPRYRAGRRMDYASFRPQEERGRDLPTKKRNDLLHVDAFPTRPTNGDLILRVFTNINPDQPRVWNISDPFEVVAEQYSAGAGLASIAAKSRSPLSRLGYMAATALHAVKLPVIPRTPYDRFMLGFHDYLKYNQAYQEGCRKYHFEFPPRATWMVFTDVVPHSVLSGQFALEQTYLIARSSLETPARAPASILERLANTALTY
jgi:hypothetical protein